MVKLYIIGNGFDLWHGLPTSYKHFYNFAKSTLDSMECYYCLDVRDHELWSDFENDLGCFEWKQFYDDYDNTDADSERRDFYGLQDELEEQTNHHVEDIKKAFQEWIEEIDISNAVKKVDLSRDAKFITFNYTSTLQHIYGITEEMVFHVHGRAEKYDDLIFGHGKNLEEEPEQDENGDSNRCMWTDAQNAAKYPFYALQKPVTEVLKKNHHFFKSALYAGQIIVIGHSLNEIDLPYFKEMAMHASDAEWLVCCYNKVVEEHSIKQLSKCGVPRSKIRTFGYADLHKMS